MRLQDYQLNPDDAEIRKRLLLRVGRLVYKRARLTDVNVNSVATKLSKPRIRNMNWWGELRTFHLPWERTGTLIPNDSVEERCRRNGNINTQGLDRLLRHRDRFRRGRLFKDHASDHLECIE